MIAEDRREAVVRPEDGVADDRRDERRDDRLDLEVVDVEYLARQERAAERRAEDRADAGPDPRGDRDPPVGDIEVEPPREQRAEPGRDLRGGSLAAGRAARADGDRRRDQLDRRNARADAAVVVMDGRDRRVGAVALGLGGELEHDETGENVRRRRHQGQPPGVLHGRDHREPLPHRRRRHVTDQVPRKNSVTQRMAVSKTMAATPATMPIAELTSSHLARLRLLSNPAPPEIIERSRGYAAILALVRGGAPPGASAMIR